MNRYPHNPWAPAIAFAAVVATMATMGVVVVLPAKVTVQPGVDAAVVAKRNAEPADVVRLERIDVVAVRPAASGDRAPTPTPTALVTTKQPG